MRSTLFAFFGAVLVVLTLVLPAEYGVDPTGVGDLLGLTEMGEVKVALAAEAEADRIAQAEAERYGSWRRASRSTLS
ncbi:hypothetical protein [Acuticoccus kandeliae]|uniref:hypothetical protein n=1 Tax=Acuticoccus kandeliae TaxID=2073160 RepID=UPI000D3E4ED3|nr:hypothetical protein [Acuticoccus kandeliae]